MKSGGGGRCSLTSTLISMVGVRVLYDSVILRFVTEESPLRFTLSASTSPTSQILPGTHAYLRESCRLPGTRRP